MIGVIERIKNTVLLKCSTLNEDIINNYLAEIINKGIYHFAEDIISLINDTSLGFNEQSLRDETARLIKSPIIKKIKRKLFIDSLALQITNDSYIEDYVQNKINIDKIKKQYIRELNINKSSNQLNMTEDLDLTEIIDKLSLYVSDNIIAKVKENTFLVSAVNRSVSNLKSELEESLKEMIDQTDEKYLKILTSELESEYKLEEKEEKKEIKEIKEEDEGEIDMENTFENTVLEEKNAPEKSNNFDKYDDMTLYNKTILALNTKEERLTRKENKLEQRRHEVEEKLAVTNKNIESNIERENKLSQRKIELNAKELELNSKLSETEVIFLNMKPLIKGLNNIKDSEEKGGNYNE